VIGAVVTSEGNVPLAGQAAIICEEVTREFAGETLPAVNRVSFQVEAGSLIVLLGPSGCGKTTLLKMINRLYEPTSGRIYVNGVEIHDRPATDLRRHIGYVIQQVGLFPHMTIAQNISVVPKLLQWDTAKIKTRVQSLMELVGLPLTYLAKRPRQLSGGEQQRVGLARALAADPPILLMDEPFAAIDAITRERLQGELLRIHRQLRKTILFVTHDVEEAFRLADKILVMKEGKLVQTGTPLEVITHPENQFVRDLLGAENLIRRLSLIPVRSVLDMKRERAGQAVEVVGAGASPVVRPEDDLRTALSHLLAGGLPALKVVNSEGQPVGEITLDDLRLALFSPNGQALAP
jgi:osmoprotectant transport system ATP-binding protein